MKKREERIMEEKFINMILLFLYVLIVDIPFCFDLFLEKEIECS